MSLFMSLASRLKALGMVGALLAGPAAVGLEEILASRSEATTSANASVEASPAPAEHRQADAGDGPHDVGLDPVARDEEEFDRKFGMCRRC